MKTIERMVEDYRHFIDDRFSDFALPVLIVSAIATVVLAHALLYRTRTPPARRRAIVVLASLTGLSLLVAGYEWWYWGEFSYSAIINIVPIAVMDSVAAVCLIVHPKGIFAALLLGIFLVASLLFVSNTVLGELFPINRIVVSGPLAI